MSTLVYHVKASPGSRYSGRRIMVAQYVGDLYRDCGTVPASMAQRVCDEIERGKLPADAVREAHERNLAPRGRRVCSVCEDAACETSSPECGK